MKIGDSHKWFLPVMMNDDHREVDHFNSTLLDNNAKFYVIDSVLKARSSAGIGTMIEQAYGYAGATHTEDHALNADDNYSTENGLTSPGKPRRIDWNLEII